MGALAGNTVFTGEPEFAYVALNGAGPVLSDGFLWVCISEVTFFKSAKFVTIYYFNFKPNRNTN